MPIQDPLTGLIIGCCFRVANEPGPGFLEKVYENALAHELRKAKVKVVQQQGIEVFYDGVKVGTRAWPRRDARLRVRIFGRGAPRSGLPRTLRGNPDRRASCRREP